MNSRKQRVADRLSEKIKSVEEKYGMSLIDGIKTYFFTDLTEDDKAQYFEYYALGYALSRLFYISDEMAGEEYIDEHEWVKNAENNLDEIIKFSKFVSSGQLKNLTHKKVEG